MARTLPEITVGKAWITICNGVWHTVYLADDEGAHPGTCTCGRSSSTSALLGTIGALLDSSSEPTGKSGRDDDSRQPD